MGSKINSVISWGRPKQKLKTTAPRGSLWRDWRNPKGSHALPFFFFFWVYWKKVRCEWPLREHVRSTLVLATCQDPRSGPPWRNISFTGFHASREPCTDPTPTPCLRRYVSFLPSLPNSYPRPFFFLFFFFFFFLFFFFLR